MLKKIPKTNAGFTLIEVLTVALIIGMLTSIVVAELNESRQKAQNKKQNEQARQYIIAIEFYKSRYGTFPDTGDTNSYCLGYEASDPACTPGALQSDTLNIALSEFYADTPKGNEFFVTNPPNTYTGYTYSCVGSCQNSYNLIWFQNDTNQSCAGGALPLNWGNGTLCSSTGGGS